MSLWNWYRSMVYKLVFRTTAFDCVVRYLFFCMMTLAMDTLLQLVSNRRLDSDRYSTILISVYFAIQWMVSFLLQCGWILALMAELEAVVFNRSSNLFPQSALYMSIFTLAAGLLSSLLLLIVDDILVSDTGDFRMRVLTWQFIACISIQFWGLGCVMAFTPRDFLVRTSQNGQPGEYIRLLVWYKLDMCILVSLVDPLPPNEDFVFPFRDPLQANAWPKLAQAPRWIINKLFMVLPKRAPAG